MGLIHARRGNTSLAAVEFKQAMAADPTLAAAHNNLGVLYAQDGNLEMAKASYQAAISADPYYAAPHQGLAEVYYKMGKTADAKAEIKLVDELRSSAQAGAGTSIQDLDMGQRLDVAQLIQQEEAKPKPKAAKPKPAPKPAAPEPKTVTTQVSAPAGTVMAISIDQALTSETATVGQEVQAHVVGDVTVGQETLIRNGAAVKGKISQAQSAGRVKGTGQLAMDFTAVETTQGWRDIDAHMVEGTLKAPGSKKSDAAKIGVGAAAGAVLGQIIGDKAGTGALIGGAAGTAMVLATKGKEVELAPGTQFSLALDQPLSITVTKTVAD
jgi:hypothetical protein